MNKPLDRSKDPEFSPVLGDDDLRRFHEGAMVRMHRHFGAHPIVRDGVRGTYFAVWAPNAEAVSVIGEFNSWDRSANVLSRRSPEGVWDGFIPQVAPGALYQFHIVSRINGRRSDKADPVGFRHEVPPQGASIVWELTYEWTDRDWLASRGEKIDLRAPISIYQVHLGSWMRVPEENNRWLTYRELAPKLADHAERLGFTHVELLPVMEHPSYESAGLPITGYFAPSGRYGTPQDLMYLIDHLHRRGIGVLLTWFPGRFSRFPFGLSTFDGTALYEDEERADSASGNAGEESSRFNFERPEVRSFLISSALFWLDHYHADGLTLPDVGAMLGLEAPGSAAFGPSTSPPRTPNLAALQFVRRLNEEVYSAYPDVHTVAADAPDKSLVSRPTYIGGFGFGYKWDSTGATEALRYLHFDPIFRKYHHDKVTLRALHAFGDNLILPVSYRLSGQRNRSILSQLPGDPWQKTANFRLLLAYFYLQPGKKLLFMGNEFGQWDGWKIDTSLDWHLLQHPAHAGILRWVEDLNRFYREEKAVHEGDTVEAGFEWVDSHDAEQSTLSWLRRGGERVCLAVLNFTPVPRHNFRVGVPSGGVWKERLNSDSLHYGGSGQGNFGQVEASPFSWHDRPYLLTITLPPLAAIVFTPQETSNR